MAIRTRNGNGTYRRTLKNAERDMRAADLHGQGWSYARIAAELGFGNRQAAYDSVMRAFEMIPTPGAKHAKRVDLERIDRLIEKNWEALERQHVMVSNGRVVRRRTGDQVNEDGALVLDADGKPLGVYQDVLDDGPIAVHATVILRLIERREKIFGYGAPAMSRVEVVTPEAIEQQIAVLEAELALNDPADSGSA